MEHKPRVAQLYTFEIAANVVARDIDTSNITDAKEATIELTLEAFTFNDACSRLQERLAGVLMSDTQFAKVSIDVPQPDDALYYDPRDDESPGL